MSVGSVSSGVTPPAYNISQDEGKELVPSHETINDPSETFLTLDVLKTAIEK